MSGPILLLTDDAMDVHASHGHPERPERRVAAVAGIREAAGDALVEESVQPVDDALLRLVHSEEHLAALTVLDANGGTWIDADTYLVPGSMGAARLAAGAVVRAAVAATTGEAEVAFAAVRPPGHHASAGRASGFCLLNNVAVAVEALRAAGLARRIGVVDWDVHHGDGTQAIFDDDPDLWYGSTHQAPLYPGTGSREDRGRGRAAGTKRNVPLDPGADDHDLVAAWQDELLPALRQFRPEAIIISAGYDAHRADPLAHLRVTEDGYAAVARMIGSLADDLGIRGVALALEGGYDLDALRLSTAATVLGLVEGREDAAEGR